MRCPVCNNNKLLFFCIMEERYHIVCCLNCAVEFGYRILEAVEEDKDAQQRMETQDS